MATLTRPRASSTDILTTASHDTALTNGIPTPFPSRAEREQAELLESLALEDIHYNEIATHAPGSSTIPALLEDTRQSEGELLPSIIHLRASCLTTLNDLLSSASKPGEHSTITTPTHELSDGVEDAAVLQQLRIRVDDIAPTLGARDAELARSLLALLTHFHMMSSLHSSSAAPGPSRRVSMLNHAPSPEAMASSSSDPLNHLRRHLSDFQIERSHRGELSPPEGSRTPVLTVQTALLWSQIDEQLETVLSLCRSSFDGVSDNHLPPQYDPSDYEHGYEAEGLPQYDPGDYDFLDRRSKSLDKNSDAPVSPTVPHASEKMRMDLEAVTQAIDRLYEVAPQLHNQRVELKKTKLDQMEKARKEGKSKQREGPPDERELEHMLELLGKAAGRKMLDQSVVINEDAMRSKMARIRERDRVQRSAFVEHLVRHSVAGRLDSQDATFPVSPAPRSATAAKLQDPNALLSLPEFIREAVPQAVSERMHMNERITLPEFFKEPVPEHIARPPRHSRFQSVSIAHDVSSASSSQSTEMSPENLSRSSSKMGRSKMLRSRSLSAPPLAWLLSNSSSRAASPAKTAKTTRPGSSHGRLSSIEASLDVIYVAEYHESLQHVLVFLTIPGASASPQSTVEAEVLLREDDDLPRLIVRCGVNTSSPLELPARVNLGKKDIRLVGENHYEVKLQTPAPPNRSRPGTPHSPSPELDSPAIMDATYFMTTNPTSLVCTSCSLPLVQASCITSYRDLPSEHWAELVDAWMCHADMKLHEQVKKNSKDGFWPGDGEVLVGGSYALLRGDAVVKGNLCESQRDEQGDEWTRVRCMCGAVVGRCQEHVYEGSSNPVSVYRLIKYSFRPVSPSMEPVRVPLSAFVVEDMNEFVQAHATYRFVIVDEEEDRPRILIWLFKPNMRLSYTTPSQYTIPKSGSIRAAKILFKLLGPSITSDLSTILNKYPGFPQAEHLYYPIDICRRIAGVLKESNKAYPESMRTMTGLDVGWLQRA